MTPEQKVEIAAFVKERDEVLLSGDLVKLRAFHAKNNPGMPQANDEVLEISLHKARTTCKTLPREARMESKRWLRERNYSSFDDGDLTDA